MPDIIMPSSNLDAASFQVPTVGQLDPQDLLQTDGAPENHAKDHELRSLAA